MEQSKKLPRIGARVWKTGIAVAISYAICNAFKIPEPMLAGVAAVIVMSPTILQTFRKGLDRLQATFIGAVIAVLTIILVEHYIPKAFEPLLAGLAVVVVMWICLTLKWMDSLVLAAAIVVVIFGRYDEGRDIYRYATERFLVTAIGVVVASLVNAFIWWPKVEDLYPKKVYGIAEKSLNEFRNAVNIFCTRNYEEAIKELEQWKLNEREFERANDHLTWFKESANVKQYLAVHKIEITPVLEELHGIINSIHLSAHRILTDTKMILEDHPEYIHNDAKVYDILLSSLEPSINLYAAIIKSLKEGSIDNLKNKEQDWTEELHKNFISAMRAAHKSPLDIFPLFEVAKVGMEIRQFSHSVARFRELLLDNPSLINLIKKQNGR
ncbi:MAG: aromatic acid exporter family protein [Armatimonadota bacterium]